MTCPARSVSVLTRNELAIVMEIRDVDLDHIVRQVIMARWALKARSMVCRSGLPGEAGFALPQAGAEPGAKTGLILATSSATMPSS